MPNPNWRFERPARGKEGENRGSTIWLAATFTAPPFGCISSRHGQHDEPISRSELSVPVTHHEKFISGLSVAKTPRSEMRRRPVVPIAAARWQPCRKGGSWEEGKARDKRPKSKKDRRKNLCEFLIPERRIINFFGRRRPRFQPFEGRKNSQMYRK